MVGVSGKRENLTAHYTFPLSGTSAPRALFEVQVPEQTPPYPADYTVAMDGQRFLVNTVVDQPTRPALTVILNSTAGLKK